LIRVVGANIVCVILSSCQHRKAANQTYTPKTVSNAA